MSKVPSFLLAVFYAVASVVSIYKFIVIRDISCLLWLAATITFAKRGWEMFDKVFPDEK